MKIRHSDNKFKTSIKFGLILRKVLKVIRFKQKDWLKLYFHINTKLRQKAKNIFEKDFFKLINNVVFGKTMENVRKYREIEIAIEMEKTQILKNKPVYLALFSI